MFSNTKKVQSGTDIDETTPLLNNNNHAKEHNTQNKNGSEAEAQQIGGQMKKMDFYLFNDPAYQFDLGIKLPNNLQAPPVPIKRKR